MNDDIENTAPVTDTGTEGPKVTRRGLLKATAATAGAAAMAGTASLVTGTVPRIAYAAGSDEPIRVGFQVHRTGIGATYGRWYERTANAAAAYMNENGGHCRPSGGDRARGRRHRPEARGRGGREAREPAQGGLRLRHAVSPTWSSAPPRGRAS